MTYVWRAESSRSPDEEEFERIYLSVRQPVLAYARAAGYCAICEEIANEVMTKVWLNWAKIDSPMAFALIAVRNHIVDLRRKKVVDVVSIDEMAADSPRTCTVDIADRCAEIVDLWAAFEKLEPEFREVVTLVIICDLPVGEVAEMLGISSKTVTRRLKKAKASLQEILGASCSPGSGGYTPEGWPCGPQEGEES